MDRELAFVVKEEILRNVLKTHTIVLLLGLYIGELLYGVLDPRIKAG
jgi:ABC-type dipeptide/oligopeptide/nickel transport system permease component